MHYLVVSRYCPVGFNSLVTDMRNEHDASGKK